MSYCRFSNADVYVFGDVRGYLSCCGCWLVTAFPADWQTHGRAAGPIRNRRMLDEKPDLVIAFNLGTPGTNDTVREAFKRGIPVRRVVP